jgi:hypothetical protein
MTELSKEEMNYVFNGDYIKNINYKNEIMNGILHNKNN